MAKKEKDINYELRYKEIQREYNHLCYHLCEEQLKNYALLNLVVLIAAYPDPSELKPKELKEFASYIHDKGQQLHEIFIGKKSAKWSWEQDEETEDENAV